MDRNRVQELLHKAWVEAVCAAGGWELTWTATDHGVDAMMRPVRPIGGGFRSVGAPLDVQLKSTVSARVADDAIVYKLTKDAFDRFDLDTRRMTTSPLLLVVLVLPDDRSRWLDVSDDRAVLERSAWWINVEKIVWNDENTAACRIEIPRSQRFDPAALRGPLLREAGIPLEDVS